MYTYATEAGAEDIISVIVATGIYRTAYAAILQGPAVLTGGHGGIDEGGLV